MQRLLIIADHSLVVQSIRLALRQTAGFQVVGFVDGRVPAASLLAELTPDVVLVDDMQDPDNALARLREIEETLPDARALLLTTRMEPAWVESAFEAGAGSIISKTVHPVALGTLLREITHGNVVHRFRPKRAETAVEECPLTTRELEILHLVAEGQTNSAIARELWVTEQTVKFHLSNTYRKLGVANRTEASRYAYVHNLVSSRERAAA